MNVQMGLQSYFSYRNAPSEKQALKKAVAAKQARTFFNDAMGVETIT
jgi:hypothetical protein